MIHYDKDELIEYLFGQLYAEQDTEDIPYEIFKQNIIDDIVDAYTLDSSDIEYE